MATAWSTGASSLARRFVRGIDRIARRLHGIWEFDDSADCLLRIAIGRVAHGIQLSDGSVLRRGDAFVELHLWNEHLAIPAHGADLRWAAHARRQFERSLRKLIERMRTDAAFADIRAVMMKPALANPQLELKVSRIVRVFGFEPAAAGESGAAMSLVARYADNLWLWLLTWTFNPRSLKARRFARRRQELWISRDRLAALYDRSGIQAWHKARRATARGIS